MSEEDSETNATTAASDGGVSLEDIEALRKMLNSLPDGQAERAELIFQLANALEDKFEETRSPGLLDEAIQLREELIKAYPHGHPRRGGALSNLANALNNLYELTGNLVPLQEAIRLHGEALDLSPDGDLNRDAILNNLALSLDNLYERTGDLEALESSICAHKKALLLRPEGHPLRMATTNNLGLALTNLYHLRGKPDILQEAICLQEESLLLCPLGDSYRDITVENLAVSRRQLFEQCGDVASLEAAIALHVEALELRPAGHPDRAASLDSLAVDLRLRSRQNGDLNYLRDAINLHKDALDLRPERHPYRAATLTGLAVSLDELYAVTLDMKALDDAIRGHRKALLLRPAGHPSRATSLNNLAISLSNMYDSTKEISAVEEAVLLLKEALELCPEGHPQREAPLGNLGIALLKVADKVGNGSAVGEAIHFTEEALQLRPNGHPRRAFCFYYLARLHLLKDTTSFDLDLALHYLRGAAFDPYASPRNVLHGASRTFAFITSNFLASIVSQPERLSQLLEIARQLIHILPRVAYLGLGLSARLRELKSSGNLGTTAAILALSIPDNVLAVELLEESRAVFWSQALQLRSPLEDAPQELAAELRRVFGELERTVGDTMLTMHSGDFNVPSSSAWNDHALALRRRQSEEAEAIISAVRARPGLQRFLLPRPYAVLREAAERGPVVILLAHTDTVYAVAITQCHDGPIHIQLPAVTHGSLNDLVLSNIRSSTTDGLSTHTDISEERKINKTSGKSALPKSVHITASPEDNTSLLNQLWHQIVKHIVTALQLKMSKGRDRPRIHWCPTGPFVFLPLHAADLCSEYLVSSYTPTLTALVHARRAMPSVSWSTVKALLVAEPFSPGMPAIYDVVNEISAVADVLSAITSMTVGDLDTSNHGKGAKLQVVIDKLPEASILHLACHGQQDPEQPLKSGFCLRDGKLTITTLMRLKLSNAFLAVLSACETAKGDKQQPDQVIHLAAAMLFVGFRSVIATMWSMGDEDGPVVAKLFYEELMKEATLDPEVIPYALDSAVAKLRARKVPAHRWASYIHIGA